ncbi:transposase [Candidatus Enterovibrio escicola]|uniref:transposase n=1 Tax=Candidatus Enterovibrio escicola TaxID=1927127 RepID=UPI000BE4697D
MALISLCSYLFHRQAQLTRTELVGSTKLHVCHNLRIPRHRLFERVAKQGLGTIGWLYGFKLHLCSTSKAVSFR